MKRVSMGIKVHLILLFLFYRGKDILMKVN